MNTTASIAFDQTYYKDYKDAQWAPQKLFEVVYNAIKEAGLCGSAMIDGRAEMQQCESIAELAAVVRNWLSEEIADRLLELDSMDLDEGDAPLNIQSIKSFLEYCFDRGIDNRPLMTLTPSGMLQANFISDVDDTRASLRFFPNDRVLVYYVRDDVPRVHEVPIKDLIDKSISPSAPKWL